MGHLPPNHVVGRVMASLHPQNAPQGTFEHKSCCFGCYTAPWWWIFSCPWQGWFRLRSWHATGWDTALVHRISFKAGVRRCPFERRCALVCRSSVMRHDLIGSICPATGHNLLFPEWISANPLPYCFDSGFSPHTLQASCPIPVSNPPEFLIIFNCPTDKHSQNFQWF